MLVKFNFKKLIILFTILLPILVIYVNGTGNGDESPNQREASPTRGNSSQHEEGVTRERSRSPPHRRMTWALAFTRMGQGSRGTEPIPAFEIFRNPATMLRNVATSEFEQQAPIRDELVKNAFIYFGRNDCVELINEMTTIQKIRVKDAFKPNHLPPSSSSKNLQSTLQSPHDLLTSSHIHPPSSPKSLPAEASSHLPIPSSSSIHPQDPPPTNSHQIPHSTHHPPSSSVTHPSIPSSSSVHPQDPSPSTTLHQSPPSPHHKTSISISELTPSIEALPEDKLEAQEREKTMPDEIRAVINEITWKEHISTPNSPLNQFLTPQGSPHGFRCILCQYDYIPGFDPSEQIAQLKPCNHKFHLKCFAEFWWGKGKKHCPLCNQHFDENKGQEKDEVVKMEESDVC